MRDFSMYPGKPLDRAGILQILQHFTIVGFNSQGYDCPILSLALSGEHITNQHLKDANDLIIPGNGREGLKYWDFYRRFNVRMPDFTDHIDIMEVLPGVRIGLKTYAGIAHCRTIQDLPIDPSADVSPIERVGLASYCGNDLEVTERLYQIAVEKEWIPLREHITAEIGIDVRSKSDAQIAEAITKARLGFRPEPIQRPHGHQFLYQVPDFIKFSTPQLQEVLQIVEWSPFTILHKDEDSDELDDDGKKKKTGVRMHKDLAAIRVKMGVSTYKFGAGGLHSQESAVHYVTDDKWEIMDSDVGSFYPKIIINQRLYPQQCGPQQLTIYEGTYVERISAKKAGRKKEGNSKKIVLNGWFGKLGSKYSMAYAPELLMQVTISGQLMLLMLIEELELNGINVVSANTDGIVTRTCKGPMQLTRDSIMIKWQQRLNVELEHAVYSGIYFRDVNNYFAVTTDGQVKRKGIFTTPEVGSGPSSSKAPHREICTDAVIAYIKDGIALDETVYRCRDVRKFVTVRYVKGGCAEANGSKVVRWYYARGGEALHYRSNGNQVADSEGTRLLMTLPDAMPQDVDYEYYVGHARKLLKSMGLQ